MNKVEKMFENQATIKGGIILFPKESALLFVKACENHNIIILGIDAFYLSNNNIQPSLENSIDFSSSKYMIQAEESIYAKAISFLREKNGGLFFEIVCE